MDPLATDSSLDFSAPHVVAVVAVAVLVALAGVALRRFAMAYGDELAELWRTYGPIAVRRMLGRRRMPATPWFCGRCRSHNGRAASRCYACGARRSEAEAPVPDAVTPASPSAGRSRRTRRS